MNLTSRDRKVMLAIVPIVLIVAYWFLLLSPQRQEAQKAGDELAQAEEARDQVESQARQVESAKAGFAKEYAQLVRLGKAIPTKVDMPSLIVQLDDAAKGTGINFTSIKKGERAEAPPAAAPPAQDAAKSGDDKSKPADAGGQPAQSAPGQAAETANNAAATSDQRNQAAQQTGAGDASTSTASKSGGLPVGGGATATTAGGGATSTAPGLDSVPLDFEFNGSFFDLADFFHRLKRFVRVTNKKMEVRGRLMTIDGLKFSAEDNFPSLKAEVKATVWLAPQGEGSTAGATAAGPATTPASAGSTGIAGPESAPSSTSTPTATATP